MNLQLLPLSSFANSSRPVNFCPTTRIHEIAPGLFRTFDFANPDVSSQGRFTTTVPQQALFMMNSPFVIEQARSLVQRDEVKTATDDAAKIQTLCRLAWQRPAEREEIRTAEKFLTLPPPSTVTLSPLEKYAQVLLLSNELGFVD